MSPRTGSCLKCKQYLQCLQNATTEEEKLQATTAFAGHVHSAQREWDYYKQLTTAAQEELNPHRPLSPDQSVPGTNLTKQHCTFGYAQQLTLPCQSRQVDPLYFKVPNRVQVFGICIEGLPHQTNYLIGERDCIGENGSKSHGPNTVISCLHHYFSTCSLGEHECHLHAENCSEQNKSKTLMANLACRTMVGLHDRIKVSCMVIGPTRCTVDGCFGMIQRRYPRWECDTAQHLIDIISRSARCNSAQPVHNSQGQQEVTWYEWDPNFQEHFQPLKGISKLHHFVYEGQAWRSWSASYYRWWVTVGEAAQERQRCLRQSYSSSCSCAFWTICRTLNISVWTS